MSKADFIKRGDAEFANQLLTFKLNLGTYAAALGVTAAQMTAQAADQAYFAYVLAGQSVMQGGAQQWTMWKGLLRNGGTPPLAGAPLAPTLPVSVAAVALGVETRFRALVKLLKASPNYNAAIGLALSIEGADQAPPNLSTVRPFLSATISGNHVLVGWDWQGLSDFLDICEIQVERGAGQGFSLLTYDTTPGYGDTQPFPATPAKWTYRAIYRVGDAQVGQWSQNVSITTPA